MLYAFVISLVMQKMLLTFICSFNFIMIPSDASNEWVNHITYLVLKLVFLNTGMCI